MRAWFEIVASLAVVAAWIWVAALASVDADCEPAAPALAALAEPARTCPLRTG